MDGTSTELAAVNPPSLETFWQGVILAAPVQLWAGGTCTASPSPQSLRQLCMAAVLVCQESFSIADEIGSL